MKIAIHLGAHRTDEDLILETLQRNEARLAGESIAIPAPRLARPAIRTAAQAAGAGGLTPASQDELLAEMLPDGADPARILLSYEAFLGIYARVLDGGRLYRDAGRRAALLRDLFPEHEIAFFLAVRNPATFVPAIFDASRIKTIEDFLGGLDLRTLRWSDPIREIRAACPDVPLTIWCNEDLPLLLPDVLDAVAGTGLSLDGEDAALAGIMTEAGLDRMRDHLRDTPADTRAAWRKVATAFLARYADADAVEPAITTPGWTDALIADLSARYEEDLATLRRMPGVTFLQP